MTFSPVSYISNVDGAGNSVKSEKTAQIAAGAGTTVVKGGPGRLIVAVVTAAGTSADNATIYDNATGAASGTILAVIAGGGNLGQIPIDLPAANGITVVNVGSGPAFTVGYS
jgi:hypothetical protein